MLEETAYFLHLTVDSDKPVMLTGAMRPATSFGAEGPMNIYHAVAAAARPACRGLGTLIVFGDVLIVAYSLHKSIEHLRRGIDVLATHCVVDIAATRRRR